MVRLAISVEGQTEERFIQETIQPHLQRYQIWATPIRLGDGGDVSLPRIRRDLNNLAHSFDKVTTFYDFYGFRGKEAQESKTSLEQKIVACVADRLRFKIIPYVQMYEFEGLLFASPATIEAHLQQTGLAAWAANILHQCHNDPEQINDSAQTAPSKRLLGQATYLKIVHGPNIAHEIGLDTLRQRCAGFGHWLTTLEALQL